MDGGLLGWTDAGAGTGEGFVAAWGLLAPMRRPGGSANPAPVGRTVPEARLSARPTGSLFSSLLSVPGTGAAFGVARRCAAEPSAGMGPGACGAAALALGLPWRFQLPRERQKAGREINK